MEKRVERELDGTLVRIQRVTADWELNGNWMRVE